MQMGNITYGDFDTELQSFEEDDDIEEAQQTINFTEMTGEIDSHGSKELLFISLVSKEEFLFNPTHADYRNFSKKDQKWQEIGKRLGGWTESQCKAKWKAFRDQYCREIKKKRLKDKRKIKWKYFKHLGFIRPYALTRKYRERLPTANIENLINNTEFVRSIPILNDTNGIIIETNQATTPLTKTPNIEWTYITNAPNQNLKESNTLEENPQEHLEQDALYSAIENMKELPEQEPHPAQFKVNTSSSNEEEEDEDPIRTFLNIESYFEKDLIALVQKEYNANPSQNFRLKVNDCEVIAKKLKKTVTQVRCKWKALRDQFIREYKRLNKHKILAPILPKWKHYDAMMFLLNFTKIQQTKPVTQKEQNNSNLLVIKDKIETIRDQQEEMEQEKVLELNSLQSQYDYCSRGVEDYEIDIDDYMIQDNGDDVEEYCNEQEFIEDKSGQEEFAVLRTTANNELQHGVCTVSTSNQEFQSEQHNPLTDLVPQQLIDMPTIEINEKNLNLTNNTISNSSTTRNNHNSESFTLEPDNIISIPHVASLDISSAPVTLADSTNPEPTPSSSAVNAEQVFGQNNNEQIISTTSSLGSNILTNTNTPSYEENDEVATFFKLVSMKVRNANLSHVALTELQIGILHLINDSLKKF
ncbi:uncharacterized protein ACRADG_003370 [Cochliomyia hominivorax]